LSYNFCINLNQWKRSVRLGTLMQNRGFIDLPPIDKKEESTF
jgi:hypothetical protein